MEETYVGCAAWPIHYRAQICDGIRDHFCSRMHSHEAELIAFYTAADESMEGSAENSHLGTCGYLSSRVGRFHFCSHIHVQVRLGGLNT